MATITHVAALAYTATTPQAGALVMAAASAGKAAGSAVGKRGSFYINASEGALAACNTVAAGVAAALTVRAGDGNVSMGESAASVMAASGASTNKGGHRGRCHDRDRCVAR